VGVVLLALLLFVPNVGIHAFWNGLIPVAPALLALAPGVWRNVCPMGSTALVARHAGLSRRRRISEASQARLSLVGVVLLLAIVPLRHVVLDTDGPATALAIAILALAAVVSCGHFEWKSAWCSGACPVHPVEKLYGTKPLVTVANAHCGPCERCVVTCPDSSVAMTPLSATPRPSARLAGRLMVGGFAGFVWGWFHVPDYAGGEGWSHLSTAYGLPLAGMAASLLLFTLLDYLGGPSRRRLVASAFAAAAIACYYWYRLPALVGFGPFPGDGALVDLRDSLPAWLPAASRAVTTTFFAWWFLGRSSVVRSWSIRPLERIADLGGHGVSLICGAGDAPRSGSTAPARRTS
jgi:Na+-translocating ferredoxin:NAD+ oxidoreductase RNF subunit RnfB